MTKDGQFRVVLLKANELVRTANEKHGLNPLAGIILGELLMGTILMASTLKGASGSNENAELVKNSIGSK